MPPHVAMPIYAVLQRGMGCLFAQPSLTECDERSGRGAGGRVCTMKAQFGCGKALCCAPLSRAQKACFVLACVALFAAIACLSGCGGGLMASQLSEDEILDSVDAEDVADHVILPDEWCSSEAPAVVSKTLEGVEDQKLDDALYREATVMVVCETSQFRISSDWVTQFKLVGNQWQHLDSYPMDESIEWVGGIPNDLLASRATAFMQMVDENSESSKRDTRLLDLYKEGFSAEVIDNKTAEDGTALLAVSAQQGLTKYQGTLAASFAWTGTDWQVTCTADKGAYQADYSPYEGTWIGSFVETSGWWDAAGHEGKCYAAKETSPSITFKEVDPVSLTAKADLSFVVHAHDDTLDNDVASVEGDTTIELKDALITLEPDNSNSYKILDKDYGDYNYTVYLENDDSGNLKLMVKVFNFLVANVSDSYSLSKLEEA